MKKIVSLMLAFSLSIGLIMPYASAEEIQSVENNLSNIENVTPEDINVTPEDIKNYEEAQSLSKYVDSSGLLIEFNDKQALLDGENPQLVAELKETYEKANAHLIKNNAEPIQETFSLMSSRAKAKPKCSGSHRYSGNLVSGTIYMNSCKTTQLLAVIAINGGVTAALALIPLPGAGLGFGLATAIYAIGGGVILFHSANGNGIKIKVLRNPISKELYPYSVTSQ